MLHHRFAERLRSAQTVVGTFLALASPEAAEIPGRAGLDFVIVDLEHIGLDWNTLRHMLRAVELSGAAALVRVSGQDDSEILRVLEASAAGLVIPFVESTDQLVQLNNTIRYAPVGRRGTCTVTRAAGFGIERARLADLVSRTNDDLVVLGQLESCRGIDALEKLIASPHALDGYLIGRSDLAADMGHPGEVGHPDVLAATEKVFDTMRDSPSALGILAYSHDELAYWRSRGARVLVYTADSAILATEYQAVAKTVDRAGELAAN